ncbi:MAG TPA: 2-amino-4-hydroxy-6-hydroxymethyldihydropteridine diphosphokinase [Thermodesulfobacteriota bacterium]|nr:2-amino-4-hydroxy-6-hydroxymethyldihydropteridine diphosphokinase [Thermodesulfobacteriota bacterium]
MPIAFIGIGSNLGNRIENCARAIEEISTSVNIITVSSFYETEPVDKEGQPDFINCMTKIETCLSPLKLLSFLKSLEAELGKKNLEKWGPRIIDLDIIFYEDLIIETNDLTIPHPRAHLRRFVLQPLFEIAPSFVHPVLRKSISELLSEVRCIKKVLKLGDFSIYYSHKSTTYPQI